MLERYGQDSPAARAVSKVQKELEETETETATETAWARDGIRSSINIQAGLVAPVSRTPVKRILTTAIRSVPDSSPGFQQCTKRLVPSCSVGELGKQKYWACSVTVATDKSSFGSSDVTARA